MSGRDEQLTEDIWIQRVRSYARGMRLSYETCTRAFILMILDMLYYPGRDKELREKATQIKEYFRCNGMGY